MCLYNRQRGRLNICCYIGWIDKFVFVFVFVFGYSTNITTNIETAVLSTVQWLGQQWRIVARVENQQKIPLSWVRGTFYDLVNMIDIKMSLCLATRGGWPLLVRVCSGQSREIKYRRNILIPSEKYPPHINTTEMLSPYFSPNICTIRLWFAYSKISK